MHLSLIHMGSLFLYSFIISFLNDSTLSFSDSPDFSKSSLSHWSSAHTLLTIKITVLTGVTLTSSSVHSVPTAAGCFLGQHYGCHSGNAELPLPVFLFSVFSPCICCLLNPTSCSFSGCLSDLLREIHKPYQ